MNKKYDVQASLGITRESVLKAIDQGGYDDKQFAYKIVTDYIDDLEAGQLSNIGNPAGYLLSILKSGNTYNKKNLIITTPPIRKHMIKKAVSSCNPILGKKSIPEIWNQLNDREKDFIDSNGGLKQLANLRYQDLNALIDMWNDDG